MQRQPVVAGQFYPGAADALKKQVNEFVRGERSASRTLLAMVPHAGFMFSGPVAGKVLARANLAKKVILLGPNHSGRGKRIAVWGDGHWKIPGKEVPVDEQLASVIAHLPGFSLDYQAHLSEHSLEVVLPFLTHVQPQCTIVPVSVAEPDEQALLRAGADLARSIQELGQDVSLVVSSDMSHFIPHEHAKRLDTMAIDKILDLDALGLYQVVRQNKISMCGALPMTMGLACVQEMGARNTEFVDYSTSGEVIGDYSSVVGYAGVLIS